MGGDSGLLIRSLSIDMPPRVTSSSAALLVGSTGGVTGGVGKEGTMGTKERDSDPLEVAMEGSCPEDASMEPRVGSVAAEADWERAGSSEERGMGWKGGGTASDSGMAVQGRCWDCLGPTRGLKKVCRRMSDSLAMTPRRRRNGMVLAAGKAAMEARRRGGACNHYLTLYPRKACRRMLGANMSRRVDRASQAV